MLALDVFGRASVVAGRAGLDRRVKWLNIIEILDDITHLQEGEFLITTAFGIDDNPGRQATLVDELQARALAGLAIQTGYYLNSVPAVILRRADELGFPVVQLPREASFASITRAVLQRLVNRQFEMLSYSEKIYRRLTGLILGEAGTGQLAAVLSDLVKRSVALLNADGDLLAAGGPEADILASWDWTRLPAAAREQAEQSLQKPFLLPGEGPRPPLLIRIVAARREILGFIALENRTPCGELDLVACGHTATVLALLLTREKAVAATEARLRGDFFDDLLSGNGGLPEVVARRAAYLGLNAGAAHLALVVAVDDFPSWAARHGEAEIHRLRESLHRAVREAVAPEHTPVLKNEGDAIVVFVPAGRTTPKTTAARIQEQIHKSFPGITVSIGIGGVCPGLAGIGSSYREAGQALRILRLTGKPGAVAGLEDLGLYRLLLELTENQSAAARFYEATVAPLFRYDRRRHGELAATLRAYLESGLNRKETASRLFIHRHTLRYRLERIAALTGRDLARWQDRLEMELGLLIAKFLHPES